MTQKNKNPEYKQTLMELPTQIRKAYLEGDPDAFVLEGALNTFVRTKIRYKDVMLLGFSRHEDHDEVFKNTYGYDWFRVEKKLSNGITAQWDPVTQLAELIRLDEEGNILGRMDVNNLDELRSYINFFGGDDA